MSAGPAPEFQAFWDRPQNNLSVGLKPCKEYGRVRETLQQVSAAAANRTRLEIVCARLRASKETLPKADSYRILMRVGVAGLAGMNRRVLSWGPLARGLAPPELGEEMGDDLAAGLRFGRQERAGRAQTIPVNSSRPR